jgi:Zn-dependent protease/predicted transcriptional regulator
MFGRSFRLFRLFGIPIQIDVTFLIVLPLFTWLIGGGIRAGIEPLGISFDMTLLQVGATPYILGLIIVVGLFISVLIHELGHALTARGYGVRTRSITLWLLGGVAQLETMPRKRGAEAVVAIVGPIVSVGLGIFFWLVLQLVPARPELGVVATRYVLTYLAVINVALAVFNMLPALPLDGGRVLRSLLAIKMDPMSATRVSGVISKVIALGLVFVALMGNLWLLLIAFFIYMAVNAETQQSMIEYMLRDIRVRDLMNRNVVTIAPNATVAELMTTMVRERHLGFPVQDDGHLVGMIELGSAQGIPPETPVGQIMQRQVRSIREDAKALDAFTKMGESGFARMIVVDNEGRMVGILTKTDLMRAIQIRTAALSPPADNAVRDRLMEDQSIEPSRPMP